LLSIATPSEWKSSLILMRLQSLNMATRSNPLNSALLLNMNIPDNFKFVNDGHYYIIISISFVYLLLFKQRIIKFEKTFVLHFSFIVYHLVRRFFNKKCANIRFVFTCTRVDFKT